jgi:hypothetical protein
MPLPGMVPGQAFHDHEEFYIKKRSKPFVIMETPQKTRQPGNGCHETGLSVRSNALEAGFHVAMADPGTQVAVLAVLAVPVLAEGLLRCASSRHGGCRAEARLGHRQMNVR